MNIVAIIGNGASVVYNPDFALPRLTEEILDRFSSQRVSAFTVQRTLSQLARAARTSDVDDTLSFEELLGPLDRMADGIEAMRRIAKYVPGGLRHRDDLKSAARFGRKLYRRSVGTTLQVVLDFSHGEGSDAWDQSSLLVEWLADHVSEGGVVRTFTLNYDCLVDSAALNLNADPASPLCVSDMADGRASRRIQILRSGRQQTALAYPLRSSDEEYVAGPSAMVLYHLHGAANWVRDKGGQMWKVKSVDYLRTVDFWKRYGLGRAVVSPVVVLTDQKAHYLREDPFAWAYRRLRAVLTSQADRPDLILIAGYGFGDAPLNLVLSETLTQTSCPVVVIGKNTNTSALQNSVIAQLGLRGQSRRSVEQRLQVLGDGLPESLQQIVV